MPGIFISYRRDDSAGHAGRLYDDLKERFGPGRVVMDVADLQPGVDFVKDIRDRVVTADAIVVVIGRRWAGRGRLNDPEDFVRLEIQAALEQNVPIFPVLVQDARMPRRESLPKEIADVAKRNAVTISDARWDYDEAQLARALEALVPALAGAPPKHSRFPVPRTAVVAAVSVVVLVSIIGVPLFVLQSDAQNRIRPSQTPGLQALPTTIASGVPTREEPSPTLEKPSPTIAAAAPLPVAFAVSPQPSPSAAPAPFDPFLTTPVWHVIAADTGADLSAIINQQAQNRDVPPVLLVALAIQQSGLRVHAERWATKTSAAQAAIDVDDRTELQSIIDSVWPDISFGLYQQAAVLLYGQKTVDSALTLREQFLDPGLATAEAAEFIRNYWRQLGSEGALCRYTLGVRVHSLEDCPDNIRAAYARSMQRARTYLAPAALVVAQYNGDRSNYDSDDDYRSWTAVSANSLPAAALAAVLTAYGRPTNISGAIGILKTEATPRVGLVDYTLEGVRQALERNQVHAERGLIGYEDLALWVSDGTPTIVQLPPSKANTLVAISADADGVELIDSSRADQQPVRMSRAELENSSGRPDRKLAALRLVPDTDSTP